jgi:dienelactone hydrolase
MKTLMNTMLGLSCALAAEAQIHTESIEYRQGDTALEGYLAYDTATQGKRPGLLIIHQWKGLTDYEKKRAQMLAQLGYNAFAVDIYGKGVRPKSPQEAAAEAGKYRSDRALLRARPGGADRLAET